MGMGLFVVLPSSSYPRGLRLMACSFILSAIGALVFAQTPDVLVQLDGSFCDDCVPSATPVYDESEERNSGRDRAALNLVSAPDDTSSSSSSGKMSGANTHTSTSDMGIASNAMAESSGSDVRKDGVRGAATSTLSPLVMDWSRNVPADAPGSMPFTKTMNPAVQDPSRDTQTSDLGALLYKKTPPSTDAPKATDKTKTVADAAGDKPKKE